MSKYLARLSFYPTLAYNMLMEKFTGRNWYDRIDKTVILGALPFKSMANRLIKDEGVRGVVSLNEEYELKGLVYTTEEWQTLGVQHLILPTEDLVAAPSQMKLKLGVNFIIEHRNLDQTVYVHCKAGRTRSTTLVACYLMMVYNMNPDDAIKKITTHRPHIWLRDKQINTIHCFYNENCVGSKNE